jgi:8-oxo-dGTP pyrophosphatase MutT (NUDIX family)
LENGETVVLLVRKLRSGNWSIPKGNAEPHLTLPANAAKEAFEEAGVRGRIGQHAAATYRAIKRVYGLKIVIEVWVYLLEVTETSKTWPEMAKRDFKWVSSREAATLLREPALSELCARLAGPTGVHAGTP